MPKMAVSPVADYPSKGGTSSLGLPEKYVNDKGSSYPRFRGENSKKKRKDGNQHLANRIHVGDIRLHVPKTINQIQANIPYMDPMGSFFRLAKNFVCRSAPVKKLSLKKETSPSLTAL